ncbi:hypothetical protein ABGB12_14265 [Actinocorallia sp. B10E7]|uniref:hypothetical protein n=1 Tax=Actinocorallia sp. B10E7 TaxID=3153558 RepID=UPI00325CE546
MTNQTSFSLSDRWAAQPLWFTFLYTAVLSGGLFALWTRVTGPDREMREPLVAVLLGVLFGLFFGAGMTWLQHWIRKKTGLAELDHHARLVVSRALRTGHPPADPSFHPALRRVVAYSLCQARKNRRAAPVAYGAMLLLGAVNTWLISPWFVLLILWFVILGAYAWIRFIREEARLAGLERALAE